MPESETSVGRQTGSRAFWVKGAGFVGAALIVGALVVGTVVAGIEMYSFTSGSSSGSSAADTPRVEVGRPPAALPLVGSYVRSEIRADGTVAVTHWIRSDTALSSIRLSAYDAPQPAGVPQATGLDLVTGDGTVVLSDATINTTVEEVDLGTPTKLLRLDYRLSGVVEQNGTVDGRALAGVTALDVDYLPEVGTRIVLVRAPTVSNLSCAHRTTGQPRSCGAPRGAGWQVRLREGDRDDRVAAQVDLRR